MRRFIREHPWQLEIVPALAFLTCVGVGLYWLNLDVDPEIRRSYSGICMLMASFVVVLWVPEVSLNHKWVVSERRKKFNYMALVSQATMLPYLWIAIDTAARGSAYARHAIDVSASWPLLSGIAVLGLGSTALMEWRRPYAAKDSALEPPPPDDVGQSPGFTSYTDSEADWSMAVSALLVLGLSVTAALVRHDLHFMAVGLPGSILLASFTRRTVVVSPDAVTLKCGIIRKRVLLSDITDCEAVHRQFLETRRWWACGALCNTTGRCMELKTSSGKTHTFGMLRPSYACELLERTISER